MSIRAVEFFAGIGLMRLGLEMAGIETVWANDIEPGKREMYVANFGAGEFQLGDVRDVRGEDLPPAELATASFPCTDLSLAGMRRGLGEASRPRGSDGGSSMFWEFARVIREMERPPAVVLLENVLGFASSHGGADLESAVRELNALGYSCDLLAIDARHFVAQSRPRMFIVGLLDASAAAPFGPEVDRPAWARDFAARTRGVDLHAWPLPPLPASAATLADVVERLPADSEQWWPGERVERFIDSLSPLQLARLEELRAARGLRWRTAYRRTRQGRAVWEIRADEIAGCLRTARGGSSKQALVEAGGGQVRVRWMTPREYARLMGAPEFRLAERRNQSLFGFGDAVCVPVIEWLCQHYVLPALAAQEADLLAAA